jgi:hypothetical protein
MNMISKVLLNNLSIYGIGLIMSTLSRICYMIGPNRNMNMIILPLKLKGYLKNFRRKGRGRKLKLWI